MLKHHFDVKDIVKHLRLLQHRGKDSFGISYNQIDTNTISSLKFQGNVKDIDISDKSDIILGHVRYTTSGFNNDFNEIQPIEKDNVSLAHNGNIPNISTHDTKYMINYLTKNDNLVENIISFISNVPASFSVCLLNKEKLYVFRDRYGIRPLSLCYDENSIMVSSESVALQKDYNLREIKPGELIEISKMGIKTLYQHKNINNCICAFELIYFMNPESDVNNIKVKKYREDLGTKLATKDINFKNSNAIVVGVPNSGIEYAKAYAKLLNLEYRQVIKKNAFGRTFILKSDEERNKACIEKFMYNKEVIENKEIIILDDTIVRGTVIKNIIRNLKNMGAKSIHIRIPSPPVVDICQLGINIRTKEELLMHNTCIREVVNKLKIESLNFLNLSDLEMFPSNFYGECFGKPIPSEILNFVPNEIYV